MAQHHQQSPLHAPPAPAPPSSHMAHHSPSPTSLLHPNPNSRGSAGVETASPSSPLPRTSSSHSLALSTRSAPASTSAYPTSSSRPSSIASNGSSSSRKIFSLTPLDADPSFDYYTSASNSTYPSGPASTFAGSDAEDDIAEEDGNGSGAGSYGGSSVGSKKPRRHRLQKPSGTTSKRG